MNNKVKRNGALILAGIVLLFTGACRNSSGAYKTISAEEAYQLMKKSKNHILLDVRTEAEFRGRHIEGAMLIPDSELEKRAASELPDKTAVILVYCASGKRSANAAKLLAEKGYARVYDFGGIKDWPYETVSGNAF